MNIGLSFAFWFVVGLMIFVPTLYGSDQFCRKRPDKIKEDNLDKL